MQQQKINKNDIRIVCKRWFQRSCGNTYHSVRIYNGPDLIYYAPFEYGYGDQCKQTAFDILRAEFGLYSDDRYQWGGYMDFTQFRDDFRERLTIEDVSRKRNL
jgi:hypothetical protein